MREARGRGGDCGSPEKAPDPVWDRDRERVTQGRLLVASTSELRQEQK